LYSDNLSITCRNPLFERRPKNFGIGGDIAPKGKLNLHRFVKWPKCVRIQRQKRILSQRLKVPPALNQFTRTLDKNSAATLFSVLMKYRPEDKAAKKDRLLAEATARAAGKEVEKKKPNFVKYGINHITALIESADAANRPKLVVIAHDVDPIEIVVWLPALCKKFKVPYVIVKGKARLGQLVHKKNASCVALCNVNNEDQREFAKLCEIALAQYNNGTRVGWGGGKLGPKAAAALKKREKAIAREMGARTAAMA
jgi:large subunit ribosomal protein L7Ae